MYYITFHLSFSPSNNSHSFLPFFHMFPTLYFSQNYGLFFFLSRLEIILMPVFPSEDNHCVLPSFQPSSCCAFKVPEREHFLKYLYTFYLLVCVCHHKILIVVLKFSSPDLTKCGETPIKWHTERQSQTEKKEEFSPLDGGCLGTWTQPQVSNYGSGQNLSEYLRIYRIYLYFDHLGLLFNTGTREHSHCHRITLMWSFEGVTSPS